MPFATAALIGGGIAAAGSLGSALIGSGAASDAAKQQAYAQQQALDLQKQVFGTTQANIAPYTAYGENALQNLQQLLGTGPGGAGPVASNPILQMLGIGGPGPMGSIDPSTFTGSPGYQYEKQQGLDAVTNAATRGPGGGNALLALQKTGQGMANQNWGQYLSNTSNAWQQMLQNLGGGVSTGLGAVGLGAGVGQNFANAAGGNLAGIGNAQSGGTLGGANAWGSALNNLVGNFNNAGGGSALAGLFSGSGPFSANSLSNAYYNTTQPPISINASDLNASGTGMFGLNGPV